MVSEFHATAKFHQTLQHEIANGFIPSGFSLQQAQNAYLDIVNEADKIHKGLNPPTDGSRLRLAGARLETGIDGLALECEHAEDALVHPGGVLVGHEPVEGLDPERELAPGQ